MRFLALTAILNLLFLPLSWAQQSVKTINGRIIDAKTNEGIQYANIGIKGSAAGTASNSEGVFVLKIAPTGSDTLAISCVGYATAEIPISGIADNATIRLNQAAIELPELTVRSRPGAEIITEMVRRIPENYDTTMVGYTAFYQENIWLGDFELTFVEAVANINRPFRSTKKPNDQIRILKGRKKQMDYSADPQLYYWINGVSNGLRGSLAEDMIKYHKNKYSPFNPANYKYYTYEHVETIKDGEQKLMVIDIFPTRRSSKALVNMRIFLDENSLALVKYTFELNQQGINKVSRKDKNFGYAIMSNVVHASLEYHKFQYTYNYKQHDGKWYLNRINRHWEIFVDSKRRGWENRLWRADMNVIMTDLNRSPAPITEGDIGASESHFANLMGNNFKDDFWEDYNFIKGDGTPPPNLDSSVVRIDTTAKVKAYFNREKGFNRGDTLRGKLTPLRSSYDVTFYHLDVDVDIDTHLIKGSNTMRFNVTQPFQRMQIDLHSNMQIQKVVFKENELPYTREYNAVYIDFPLILKSGEESIKIYYEGVPKEPDYTIPMDGGALWERDSLGNVWAQMVCQGSGASVWWPNKDHLSDEPDSMKIWITIPSDYAEISNGRLMRKVALSNNKTRYEWEVSYPINNYNVTYNIGKYIHWTKDFVNGDTLTMNFYALSYHRRLAESVFSNVPKMLRTFENNYGKYPFPRDGFTLLESIYPMEHQSGVCLGKLTSTMEEVHHLMWHESAHEWWGNAVSCQDMADLWIHEAFATYAEILMYETTYGKDEISILLADQLNAIHAEYPVVGIYEVNHIHYEIGDMYSKGSLVLHTLRSIINNDDTWNGLLLSIQERFRYKTTITSELISWINEYLKKDYTWFFDQYLHKTKLPVLKLKIQENESSLVVKYKWEVDVANFNMPVKVTKKVDQFGWVYPTSQWQTLVLSDMLMDDFEVDEENFLITVDYDLD